MKAFIRRAALLVASLAVVAGATPVAQAQVSRAMTVAVLTFGNTSGYGGSVLQNTASAAIESALIESGRYDVVKRDLVEKTMSDLTLSYPLGRTGIVQLAQALEADAIISGDVSRVTQLRTGQVNVTMRVEMTDRSSGELINGAIVTEQSGLGAAGASQDVLLNEALNKAASAAVRAMNDRILPEGTVFSTSSRGGVTEVLINIGSNSGVREGMEFIVLRNREQVGRIRASEVSPTDTTAAVIATTRGVQPEDKVRAIFRLENIPLEQGGTGQSSSLRRPKIKVGDLLMGVAALAGLVSLTQGSTSSGVGSVRNAVAQSSGPNNGAPFPNLLPFVPNIHVKWSRPVGIRSTDILGYFVYRGNATNPVAVIDGDVTDLYDTGEANEVTAAFDSSLDVDAAKTDGLIPGAPNRYTIRAAYQQTTTDDTGNTTEDQVKVTASARTGVATAIWPATLQTVTASDLTSVPFTFFGSPGADRYIIQVSDSPNFTNSDTYPTTDGLAVAPLTPPTAQPVMRWLGGDDDNTTETLDEDIRITPGDYTRLETINANLQTGRVDPSNPAVTIYWRVGARSSRDDVRPEGGGWVWSDYQILGRSGVGLVPRVNLPKGPVKRPGDVQPPTGGETPSGGMSRTQRSR